MSAFRTRVRLARRLHDAWVQNRQQDPRRDFLWNNLAQQWSAVETCQRRLVLAARRGLTRCQHGLRDDLRWHVNELNRAARAVHDHSVPDPPEPGLADWICELLALEREFGTLDVLHERGMLRVRTEPIRLHGIDLGPFAIEYHWNRPGRGLNGFELVPLEPNPAAGRESVTHPHVNDGELCAGDATAPIERAVEAGRLADAFLMIRSVLGTYNPRSAHVPLADWDGPACGECGRTFGHDDGSVCSACGTDLCDGCVGSCSACESTRCGNCLRTCESCDASCCPGCLDTTADGDHLCPDCRAICSGCHGLCQQSELNDDDLCGDCAAVEAPTPTPTETLHGS